MGKTHGVYIEIADLIYHTMKARTAEERSDWLLSFAECLRTGNPELNEYGAELLKKTEEYRAEKSEKARQSAQKRWDANACERMQTDANACERIESHTLDANTCYNKVKESKVKESKVREVSQEREEEKEKVKKENDLLTPKKPDNLETELFTEFLAYRKNIIKAPLTQRALEGLVRESNKAGKSLSDVLILIMEKGWRGFDASYCPQKITYQEDGIMSIDELMQSMGGEDGS